VKVDRARVGRLLEYNETWLDIIRWTAHPDPERLEAAACSPAAAEVHEIMAQELAHDRGELVHSSGKAWAAAS